MTAIRQCEWRQIVPRYGRRTRPPRAARRGDLVGERCVCVVVLRRRYVRPRLGITLSVIGVGVTTRVHVAGPLFDDFFYTDRAEI